MESWTLDSKSIPADNIPVSGRTLLRGRYKKTHESAIPDGSSAIFFRKIPVIVIV